MNCLIDKKNSVPLDAKLILNKDAIFKLPRPHLGQVAIAKDTNEIYVYMDNGWQIMSDQVKMEGEGLKMSLYELNRSIMEQLPTMTDFDKAIEIMNAYKEYTKNQYYMLYGKDLSYFTMFNVQEQGECDSLGHGVIECLANVGEVRAIDLTEAGDAIEIWVVVDGNATCLYLFPYDTGVVTVKE